MDQPPPRIAPASGQNKLESGPFSALATCANEAVLGDSCIILTPWFSETKGFFCFRSAKGPQRMALEKCVFPHMWYLKKEANFREKKPAEHCLTHVNKTACEIWSVSDKVHFWVKILTPFFHETLQLLFITCCSCIIPLANNERGL